MTPPAVTASHLRLGYREPVLSIDHLALPSGCTVALIGPNGSGKTTFLLACAGLLRPMAGSLRVAGRSPTARDGRVALVPQHVAIDEALPVTARDAVTMGRYARRGAWRPLRADDRSVVTNALERLDIGSLAGRQVRELSGGQRQRVLVAQGLAQGASLLLLDEPITGVDVASRHRIVDAITVERESGTTVVFSTHDLADARLADVVVLLAGRIVAFGSPDEVLNADHLAEAYGERFVPVEGGYLLDEGAHHHDDA